MFCVPKVVLLLSLYVICAIAFLSGSLNILLTSIYGLSIVPSPPLNFTVLAKYTFFPSVEVLVIKLPSSCNPYVESYLLELVLLVALM